MTIKICSLSHAVFFLILLATFCPAFSEPVYLAKPTSGYTYFNRPGATIALHNEDIEACLKEAAKVRSFTEILNNGKVETGLFVFQTNAGLVPSAVENCMVVKGWRVVRVLESEGALISSLPRSKLIAKIEPWIGDDKPHGDIVRMWNNDAASASTARYERWPNSRSISFSIPKSVEPDLRKASESKIKFSKLKPAEQVSLESVPPLLKDSVLLVFRIRGLSQRNGNMIVFGRMTADDKGVEPGSKLASAIVVGTGLLFANKEGNWMSFIVPPGHWQLLDMGSVNFCLGAPAFEAQAGEVIYAGAFDLGAENFGPEMSIESAQQWLGSHSAADRIRPAQYTNGWTAECGNSSIYAIEVTGAPFKADYHWGSVAKTASSNAE